MIRTRCNTKGADNKRAKRYLTSENVPLQDVKICKKKYPHNNLQKRHSRKHRAKKKGVQRKFKIKAKLIHNDNLKKKKKGMKIQSNNLQKCCTVG